MSTFRGQEGTCEVMEELVGDWAAPEVLVGDRDLWCGTGPHCMFGWGLGPPEHPVGDWARLNIRLGTGPRQNTAFPLKFH
jgi:hypothetical protein